MYGKIFASIYDGTLVEDWRALITFQQMIVLCDADGTVDMTPSTLSRRTGIPIEHIKAGIDVLENPDPWSRTPDEEGRRIIRLEPHRPWGWHIVNHQKYKSLQDADTVREQNRIRKQRQREKSRPVTESHVQSRHTDTDTDTEKDSASRPWDLAVAKGVSRRFLGKLAKKHGTDKVDQAVVAMIDADPAEPSAYITGILNNTGGHDFLEGVVW